MEASTNIKKMLTHEISVPKYQRAYSWELQKHVQTFLKDLEEHIGSSHKSKYYFGHFLFEDNGDDTYNIIDGQQRATTIIICLSALFNKIKQIDSLTNKEDELFEDLIIRKSKIKFSTVDYDNQDFIDYIITRNKSKSSENIKLETNSATRFVEALHYFTTEFEKKDTKYLRELLSCITFATCTTHEVNEPVEAIQMFIFQNDRGKTPTQLEILKSKFMFHIHLKAGTEEINGKLTEIIQRFENIYKNISHVDNQLAEDEILRYAYRIYKNNLNEPFSMEEIDKLLQETTSLDFIKKFSLVLENSFESIKQFFAEEKENFEIHSLIMLGGIGIAYPFIIKSYIYNISIEEQKSLFTALEHILIRNRLINTRADLETRLNDVYKKWTESYNATQDVVDHIKWLKSTDDWWWSYWNNEKLDGYIHGYINHSIARFILWKYENHLNISAKGYEPLPYTQIKNPALEHIAPQTPKEGEKIATGYCEYTDKFKEQYLDCFGNYLLISTPHNSAIKNNPFSEKCKTYDHLTQQREVQKAYAKSNIWNEETITERHKKITDFILNTL